MRLALTLSIVAVMTLMVPCTFADENHRRMSQWFRDFKNEASDQQLYNFLWQFPKGADLHHHLSGSAFSEWWYELAINPQLNGGYHYYTRVKFNHCRGYGTDEFGPDPQYLMFRTLQESSWERLDDCEKGEYLPLIKLSEQQQQAFLDSIRLDKQHEGRDEFFQTHWQRLNEMTSNPTLMAQLLLKNMQAYQQEGLIYLETQVNVANKLKPDGEHYSPEAALAIYKQMLASPAAKQTGVRVKFQYALLRFLPNAEERLRWMYDFVDRNRDIYVGINFVGREDNDKGHPLRFLPVLRELRHQYPSIPLAIHAGEVDEPNAHVRNTLLLGANRIGHGLNTITDPDTLLLMRHGPYLIEINLISNKLLEYVENYRQHPFPEYLRTGIPVALSTDDRGMWDSNLTDEYFIAVKHFNLSWQELVTLSRNGLTHSFLPEEEKNSALAQFQSSLDRFIEARLQNKTLEQSPPKRQFICGHTPALCALANEIQ
ncbi:adenosine deaminase [Alteromonas aestuariivivens]|uniref:Adenosine deaminase n=1 Tax=Alteromonas aestuariivivens TaxID=1938339 RepID=A0A3D8MBA1_9ALTE|nr:adenosine deaminase [Alteromonas aestuariivivens]RDV27528.1 adenosine deaminase [Alteromonas aestuariivivens]